MSLPGATNSSDKASVSAGSMRIMYPSKLIDGAGNVNNPFDDKTDDSDSSFFLFPLLSK